MEAITRRRSTDRTDSRKPIMPRQQHSLSPLYPARSKVLA